MKRKIIIFGVVFLIALSNLMPVSSSDRTVHEKEITNTYSNPTLNFSFDKHYLILYLENIGDETAYNVTITIQVKGFILFGSGNDPYPNPFNMEPGERKPLIALPLVFGFGPIRVIYTASALNADPTSFTLKAFLIGLWLFLWY